MAVTANCTHAYTDASGKQKKCGVIEPFLDPITGVPHIAASITATGHASGNLVK